MVLMNTFLGIMIGLVILTLLVVIHEFGHFLMARRNGVKVNEFAIGIPPRLVAWRKNPKWHKGSTEPKWLKLSKAERNKPQGTMVISFSPLLIGGFCAMDGESSDGLTSSKKACANTATTPRKGTFDAASFGAKTKILFGGVLMNWLAAVVIFTTLAWTGMPEFINNQFSIKSDAHVVRSNKVIVTEIIADSPAAKAGFQSGDRIVAIDIDTKPWAGNLVDAEAQVYLPSDVINFGTAHAGETVQYIIMRDGRELVLTATLNPASADYQLGAAMDHQQALMRSTWSAPIVGVGVTTQLTVETFRGLGGMVWNLISGIARQFSFDGAVRQAGQTAIGAAGESVSGPVGIIGVIFPAFAESGLTNLAFLTALISVSLACMNVLPIPALDGGRWLLIAIYRIRHKTLTKEVEERIVSRAMMVLLFLIVLISILDITRLF